MAKLELRLAKILRHVHDDPVLIQTLASKASRSSSMTLDLALSYIYELIDLKYLALASDTTVMRGSEPYPPEITVTGYYAFKAECWSCEQTIEKHMSIDTSRIDWLCPYCDVKWVQGVG